MPNLNAESYYRMDLKTVLGWDIQTPLTSFYWGLFVSTILYGISVLQFYIYLNGCKDSWRIRTFVIIVFTMDTVATVLAGQVLFYYLVINFENPIALLEWTTTCNYHNIITVVEVYFVQLFFASRIYLANKHRSFAAAAVVIFTTIGCVFGLTATVFMFRNRIILDILTGIPRVTTGLTAGFYGAADITASVALCIFLRSVASDFNGTNQAINRLVFYVVDRAILVTIMQVGFLLLFVIHPTKLWWMPFYLSLSKVYVNTSLAMLNSRSSLRSTTLNQSYSAGREVSATPLDKMGFFEAHRAPSRLVDIKPCVLPFPRLEPAMKYEMFNLV